MQIRNDEPIEDGSYRATLKGLAKKDPSFGKRLLCTFRLDARNTEVGGFTSLSPSTQANPFPLYF